MSDGKFSPMLDQYFGMKGRHPEAILLSRVGDFYEAYGDDAETIARALQIALTSKEAGGGRRVAMAGVPHHALAAYLSRLVAQRFVVALAEQLEVPVPNKLVRRDVVRLVTPGTLIEDQLLEGKHNNYLASIASIDETFALAYADVSTGYCAATAVSGPDAYEELLAELGRIGPSEIVADVPAGVRAAMAAAIEALGARLASPSLGLVPVRGRERLDGFSHDESLAIDRAADALGAFVKRTGVADAARGDGAAVLRPPQLYHRAAFVSLDPATRKHLELTRSQGQNPNATLLATLDRCVTAMGSRLLARWIVAPLVSAEQIGVRHDAVSSLCHEHTLRETLREALKGVFDLERIAQKVRVRRASPRDLASLRRTLDALSALPSLTVPALRALLERVGTFDDVRADLQTTLCDEPPMSPADGGAIRPEADEELARCVALRGDARSQLSALEERERVRTGIKSLKIKYSGAFGYAIEIGRNHVAAVPPDYVRKQTLANGERYVTAELKELELAISTAQTRQSALERALFEALVDRVAARAGELLAAAAAVAEIDVLAALAQCAAERGYVRPKFVDDSTLSIEHGRHPVMEAILHADFVPNDLALRRCSHRFILLTGPNMGGKSTYLRQAGLLTIMAQIGSFVPARGMTLGIVDRIFTRIGAGDDLTSGQSTFFMEMAEAANILRCSTRRSLLLIDEVGRGTGTLDGLSIAQAICEFLLGQRDDCPMVLFATHFHELCTLAEHWALVANYHITAVRNTARDGAPVFSHRVQPGSSSRSFGIEVAKMAGLPPSVVERAREIAEARSGTADVEAQVPLRKNVAERPAAQRQLPLLHGD